MDMTVDDRELLIRIDTKLTVVCGEDGRGGELAAQGARLRALEDARNRDDGEHSVTSLVAVVSGIGGLLAAVGHMIWASIHGGR